MIKSTASGLALGMISDRLVGKICPKVMMINKNKIKEDSKDSHQYTTNK